MEPITTFTMFKTSDGKTFESEADAHTHQTLISLGAELEKFLASDLCTYKSSHTAATIRRIIPQWEAFKSGMTVESHTATEANA